MPPTSKVGAASAARSSLLRSMDQISAFVAPSTCMGPPPTESPGWCQVNERGWHTAEPIRGKHDRAPSHSRWNGKCSKEWRGQVHRHQVPARHQLWLRRASGAPSEDRWQVADIGSTNDFHKATTSRVTAGPIQGSGLQGQVTTATPFAPRGAGHQEGQRETPVDTGRDSTSTRRRLNGRGLRVLSGGIAPGLDAAPFCDRRRQASCTRG